MVPIWFPAHSPHQVITGSAVLLGWGHSAGAGRAGRHWREPRVMALEKEGVVVRRVCVKPLESQGNLCLFVFERGSGGHS